MKRKLPPIHNLIKPRLEKLGKSIGWLSRETNLDRVHLGRIIRWSNNPNLGTAKRIAKTLNCMIDDLWYL